MFNINPLLLTIILASFIAIISGFYIHCRTSKFENFEDNSIGYVKTLKTIEEQKKENETFLKNYNEYIEKEKLYQKYQIPLTWNNNNTIESMKLQPCLGDVNGSGRMTCYSAPLWWYPNNKYDHNNFRSVYYGDYYNPIYNYLGNAQEMYWDFKSVRNTGNVI